MKFRVSVTEVDIKKGTQRDPKNCALARAIRRHKPLRETTVGGTYFYPKPATMDFFILPDEAQAFLREFDRGTKGLKPFEFVITLPDDIFDPPPPQDARG